MTLGALVLLDWLVLAAYGALVVFVGWRAHRRQVSGTDHMLAGRRLPWWAIGISLIATSFSAVSLVVWTEKGAQSGLLFLQLQIGDLAGMLIVLFLFLPWFARQPIVTAYEYIELRFGVLAARLASAAFMLTVLARAGVFLYATAKPLAWLIPGLDLYACIAVVGVVALAYSALGGMGAVVWTDTIQLVLILVGVGACLILAAGDLGGGTALVEAVSTRTPPIPDMDGDPARWPTLWTSLLAYGALAMAVFGTNQQTVQRFLASRDLRSARGAGLLGWGLGAVMTLATLSLGAILAAWFASQGKDPGDAGILAGFVDARVGAGLTGIIVAALLAATMSSMDSAVHSLATATWVDFVRPRNEVAAPKTALRWSRGLTIAYGVLAIGAGLLAAWQAELGRKGILDLLLEWMGLLYGPILGLFLLGMLTRGVGQAAAVGGLLVGYAAAVAGGMAWAPDGSRWIASHAHLHSIWTCALATLVTLAGGLLLRGIGVGSRDT